NLHGRQPLRQQFHNQRILRPAPRHNQLLHASLPPHKPLHRIHHRSHRKLRTRSNSILRSSPIFLPQPQQFLKISPPIIFPPRGFRRLHPQIRIPQQLLQQGTIAPSSKRHPRIPVKPFSPLRQVPHQRINQHIPRPSIKRHHFLRVSAASSFSSL